ncbi:hypothetical protein [Gordonia polyisoprenivorans]|uniref:hypothetical protein n=1 Tax=Gordonia polyisoprenivorans TaxID=84595 RepID=UPI000B99E780|nr:hypothetical protein [Gordonia polyisoprenivorans]OZC31808.1 hypothetical protein CJJ17_10160 [Gordonia polyisoprenivorans]
MSDITPEQARAALTDVDSARRRVPDEVGLPQTYWSIMGAGWVALGVLTDVAPAWVVTVATVAFGVGHSIAASRLLDGRRARRTVQLRRSVTDRRIPLIVIAILLVAVACTVGLGFGLDADGATHAATWAALIVGAAIGFGGNTIFTTIRRRVLP